MTDREKQQEEIERRIRQEERERRERLIEEKRNHEKAHERTTGWDRPENPKKPKEES